MNKVIIVLAVGILSFSIAGNAMDPNMKGMKHETTKAVVTNEKMVVCPVTNTKIDPKKAAGSSAYKGKIYYFCCSGCKPLFDKSPEKYIKTK